jgi:exopolysaccharide biosynthesis polyprenyl glycosylphosphotransferase
MSVTSLGANADAQSTVQPLVIGPQAVTALAAHTDLHVVAESPRGDQRLRVAVLPVVIGLVPALVIAFYVNHFAPWAVAATWVLVAGMQASDRRHAAGLRDRIRSDLKAGIAIAAATAFAGATGMIFLTGARWGMVVAAAGIGTTVLARLLVSRTGPAPRRVVLVGSQQDIESHARSLRGDDALLAGSFVVDAGPAPAVHQTTGVPTTTSLDTLDELVNSVDADLVLVLPSRDTDAAFVRRLTWALEKKPVAVAVATPVTSVAQHRLTTSQVGDRTVVEVSAPGASRLQERCKGAMDRVGASLILLVVSPLMLFLWAAVRLDSKGPGFFVQTRVGRDGTLFRMVKLRTMYADAESMKQALLDNNESDGGVLFKIRRDPRVTRVGFWLRRSSLDELPQLFNIVRGDMSLIGPRPALPSEVATYDEMARRRLVVKPGLTGLWQVSGRSDLSWEESLGYDLYYTDNWRLVDDLAIAGRTVSAVTQGRGAY